MAIDERNFSVEGVQDILGKGNSALQALNIDNNDSNILTAIERIKSKIVFLQWREEELLSLFPTPNDRDSVRNKIIKYKNTYFPNFSGINLAETFIADFARAAKSVKNKTLMEENALAEFILQKMLENPTEDLKKANTAEEVAKVFNSYLTATVIVTEKGGSTKENTKASSTRKNVISKDCNHILAENLTPIMHKRLRDILHWLNGENPEKYKNFINLKIDSSNSKPGDFRVDLTGFNTHKNSMVFNFKSQWFNVIQGKTYDEIKTLVEQDRATWFPIVQKANYTVLNLLIQQVPAEGRQIFKQELLSQLIIDPYIFFVGKAATQITGLLGEITTIVAIKELTGKTVPINWVANNTTNDNKKVSVDVVLDGCLGINVKNTTENLLKPGDIHKVSFIDRNPKDIFDKILEDNSYSDNLSDAFQTSYFNLSYRIQRSKPHVIAGSNSTFNSTMVSLLDFRQKLINYLYAFAPELMFMETDELDKQLLILDKDLDTRLTQKGNILYMVGGVPFFPSEMLEDLKTELDSLEVLIRSGKTKYRKSSILDISGDKSETIIDVLNNRANNHQSVALSQFDTSNYKSKMVQLRTSWVFQR